MERPHCCYREEEYYYFVKGDLTKNCKVVMMKSLPLLLLAWNFVLLISSLDDDKDYEMMILSRVFPSSTTMMAAVTIEGDHHPKVVMEFDKAVLGY